MKENIIFVKNFFTKCFIGIYPEERKKKQNIKISVKLYIKRANDLDDISGTVSYDNILVNLEEVTHYEHINLVETLALKLSY
ncbi:dihydroneopterin aldolase, partial [Pelagibacteraceae bacterium]|nr:dihydroneopterin aldolase [Pelagibacteraceae bacterium]